MTLAELQRELQKLPLATGKQARAYICGPETFKSVLSLCEAPSKGDFVIFYGVTLIPHRHAPDNGRFYPASYLEQEHHAFTRPISSLRFGSDIAYRNPLQCSHAHKQFRFDHWECADCGVIL